MSKTPDKIYIPGEWLHIPSNHFETEDSPGATEYIRKEALLEWANKMSKVSATIGEEISYNELIEHIKSL
jgi:hypothetical protein